MKTPRCLESLLSMELAIPSLAPFAKSAVLLHPRPDEQANPAASNIGQGFLWPDGADLPRSDDGTQLAFIIQIFSTDLPEINFPTGADILQVFWKPDLETLMDSLDIKVIWHSSSGAKLVSATETRNPFEDPRLVPKPCTLYPQRVNEYPHWTELLGKPSPVLPGSVAVASLREPALHERKLIRDGRIMAADLNAFYQMDSCAPGTKAVGWPHWLQDSSAKPPCHQCGGSTDHLLTLASSEFEYGTRWQTEPFSSGADPLARFTGLEIGDCGSVSIMYCVSCAERPTFAVVQSS